MAEKGTSKLPLTLLALGAGIAIGVNWPKIEKYLAPFTGGLGEKAIEAYASMISFLANQKETLEDGLAEAQVTKRKEKVGKEPLDLVKKRNQGVTK